jgi:hypothetical protein
MAEDVRAVPGGYGPRYCQYSVYAPQVSWAWDDPAEETERGCELWLPPGHAHPVLTSTPPSALTAEETP